MRNILVAGCGYLGSALAGKLVRDGHKVTTVSRSGLDSQLSNVRVVHADLLSPALGEFLPECFDVVVYAVSPDERTREGYLNCYQRALANLLSVLEGQSARVLLCSSTAVYGQNDGSIVDENSPTIPYNFRGDTILGAEKLISESSFEATSIRFAGIYGPGRTVLLDKVRQSSLASGQLDFALDSSWTNRIHLDDCVGVLRHLIGLTRVMPCYVAADSCPALRGEVLQWLSDHHRQNAERDCDLVGWAAVSGKSAGGLHKDCPMQSKGKRCLNSRLLHSGYEFKYPDYKSGYLTLIDRT